MPDTVRNLLQLPSALLPVLLRNPIHLHLLYHSGYRQKPLYPPAARLHPHWSQIPVRHPSQRSPRTPASPPDIRSLSYPGRCRTPRSNIHYLLRWPALPQLLPRQHRTVHMRPLLLPWTPGSHRCPPWSVRLSLLRDHLLLFPVKWHSPPVQ